MSDITPIAEVEIVAPLVSGLYNLAVGDYVELVAYQNSGGNLDFQATSRGPVLAMTKL
jgi:hypothetical protein